MDSPTYSRGLKIWRVPTSRRSVSQEHALHRLTRWLARSAKTNSYWSPPEACNTQFLRLTALDGINSEMASYIAMRAGGEPDAFPLNDQELGKIRRVSAKQMLSRDEAWRPWRAYAAMHLWAANTTF